MNSDLAVVDCTRIAGPAAPSLLGTRATLFAFEAASKGGGAGRDDCGARPDGQDEDAAIPVLRVLLIEDDAVDAKLIRACAATISTLRMTCEVVSSIAAARERVAGQAFDLCITDFWLGFESSLSFVAGMSGHDHSVPVIVLTSLSTPEIRGLCLQAGATSVIGKEHLSPGVLESAVAAAMRDHKAVTFVADDRRAGSERGRGFLDQFARVMRPPGEVALRSRDGADADREPRPVQAAIRAFAALSETARLAVLEQITAAQGDGADASAAADLVEAVAKACSLVGEYSRPIAFPRPVPPMRLGCDEPALIFLAYELVSRVGAVATADRSTINVDLRQEDGTCTLRVSGPAHGGMPALPVTFGTLFSSILRVCHGDVEIARDPGHSITLVARFPEGDILPANVRAHRRPARRRAPDDLD